MIGHRSLICIAIVALWGAAACNGATDDEPEVGDTTGDDDDDTTIDDTDTCPLHDCSDWAADWLMCDDFEAGDGDLDTWLAQSEWNSTIGADDPGRMTLSADQVHGGNHALFMPAAEESGYQGAEVEWRKCLGPQESGCELDSFEQLYFRSWIRFAEDHQYVHHFISIGGSQPDQFWSLGSSGCLPSGRYRMGTAVDFDEGSHDTFFYTYHPEMSCSANCVSYMGEDWVRDNCDHCDDIGMPTCEEELRCCWGEESAPAQPAPLPVGEWFCFEMMVQANTPEVHDGVMAYWIDGVEGHRRDDMMWRIVPELALNRVALQHYIESSDADGHSNQVWFDDVVVSTGRIGCE